MTTNDRGNGDKVERAAHRLVVMITENHDGRLALLRRPGDRANLRRAVGLPPTDARWLSGERYLVNLIPDVGQPGSEAQAAAEWALYGVAAMMAAQPSNGRDQDLGRSRTNPGRDTDHSDIVEQGAPVFSGSLGRSLAYAVHARKINGDSTENRLLLLCRQDLTGVHRLLPATVRQLRNIPVRIDWKQLIVDLSQWQGNRDVIARQWLRDYYRGLDRLQSNAENDNQNGSEN